MPDVIDQLRAYAEAAEAAVPEVGPVPLVVPDRSRRWALPVAAVLLIIVGVVGAIVFRHDEDDSPVSVGAGLPPAEGRWDELPQAPVVGRVGHVMVATDDELIVWGGRRRFDQPLADGAAWSFAERRWRKLAPSPLSPRADALAVWTGREVLILGGAGGKREMAAYDPVADSWREMLPVTFDADASFASMVWTGSEIAVFGVRGRANEFLPSDAYVFEHRWESLPPMPIGGMAQKKAVWTGEQILVLSLLQDRPVLVQSLDVSARTWATPSPSTEVNGTDVDPDSIVWADDRLVLAVHYDTPGNLESGAAFDPVTGDVAPLPASLSSVRFPAQVVGDLVMVGDRLLDRDGRWRDAADVPTRNLPRTAVHDGRYYVWGGDGCGPGANCVDFVDVTEGLVWTSPGAPPEPEPPPVRVRGGASCGATDGFAVQLTIESDEDRMVVAEVEIAAPEPEVVARWPFPVEVRAGERVTDLLEIDRQLTEAQYNAPTGTVRVRDEAGNVVASETVPLGLPIGMGCG